MNGYRTLDFTSDIIKAIDNLSEPNDGKTDNQYDKDPRVDQIGDLWYDEGHRIFDNMQINWESLNDLENYTGPIHLEDHTGPIPKNAQEAPDLEAFESDKCAWYVSYHYVPRTFWGIHINFSCLQSVANKLNLECTNLIGDTSGAKKGAFLYLFTHELFHYIVDNACSVMEIITKDPNFIKSGGTSTGSSDAPIIMSFPFAARPPSISVIAYPTALISCINYRKMITFIFFLFSKK